MADPVNYCSWLYRPFCISQSEWATWTQAGLTVVTFVIALVKQHQTDKRSAEQKAASDRALLLERAQHAEEQRLASEALKAEKLRSEALRARALAISFRIDLANFSAAVTALSDEESFGATPSELFKSMSKYCAIKNRELDALSLLSAADPTLRVIDAALRIHTYLSAATFYDKFDATTREWLITYSTGLTPVLSKAEAAIGSLIDGQEK